jgi:hypothetical protein
MADPRLQLDANTQDRLVAGLIAPEDAPPAYAEVAGALQTLGRRLPPPDAAAEVATIRTMTEVLRKSTPVPLPRWPRRRRRPGARIALVVTTSLLGTTGVAFAGGLPDAAQSVASDLLAKVGITVPGPAPESDQHPDARGNSPAQQPPPSAQLGHEGGGRGIPEGAMGAATDPVHEGGRGDRAASGSQGSDDGRDSDESASGGSIAAAPVPQDRGTGRGNPEGGDADAGRSSADEVSLGRSEAGSVNADGAETESRERAPAPDGVPSNGPGMP